MDVNKTTEGNIEENRSEDQQGSVGDERRKVDEKQNELIEAEPYPLLLEDSTLQKLPKYVQKLLNQVDIENATQNDLLALLTYCIALEAGFVLMNIEQEFPSFWGFSFHSRNVNMVAMLPEHYCDVEDSIYSFDLKLINYSKKRILLFFHRIGDYFCITFTPEISPGRSICLSIGRYVLSPKITNIAARLRNLHELSFLLKDKIFSPIRNSLMEESKVPYPGLTGIPTEILITILQQMKLKDIQLLSKTCWKMRTACENYYEKVRKNVRPAQLTSVTTIQPSIMSFDLIY